MCGVGMRRKHKSFHWNRLITWCLVYWFRMCFCAGGEETSAHIFLHCEVVMKEWKKVMWLNFNFLIPHNLFVHFECWSANKKLHEGYWSI
jgi:hypothetical protein